MRKIECESVHVEIHSREGTVALTVPAYTVDATKLRLRLLDIADAYFAASELKGELTSLGDFALFLLVLASQDPRAQ